jgi:hypothetical protein
LNSLFCASVSLCALEMTQRNSLVIFLLGSRINSVQRNSYNLHGHPLGGAETQGDKRVSAGDQIPQEQSPDTWEGLCSH